MIIGGIQTGNTRWLAAHLQNAADNETIELAEVSGTVARDVDGALAEFDAYALGTRATEGVYAAFINPPEPLERAQYMRAIALIEERLGLTGQPRIVLFHIKNGREHCHIAWSRIDTRRLRAIPMSHDRQKLRRCAQELAAEFGLELPPGLAQDRGAERFNDPPQPTRAEKAMEAHSGLSREERRELITQCYRLTDTAQAFVNSLEAAGFMLARGDKRCFVVVDTAGDVHALARQIDGAKTKDVKKKLEGLTLSLLPPVERAKVLMLQRAAAQQDAARSHRRKQADGEAERERLEALQKKRRADLDLLWQVMKVRHMHEWKVALAHVRAEREHRIARRHWLAVGLALYLKKIAFIRHLVEYYEERSKRLAVDQYRMFLEGVRRRHENEAAELKRRHAALDRLERREADTFAVKFGEDFADGKADSYRVESGSHVRVTALAPEDVRFGYKNEVDLTALATSDAALFRVNTADVVLPAPQSSDVARIAVPAPEFRMFEAQHIPSTAWTFRENAADITGFRFAVRSLADDDRTGLVRFASSSSQHGM